MTFKNMAIRVDNIGLAKFDVLDELEAIGYNFCGLHSRHEAFVDAKAFFTYEGGLVTQTYDLGHFNAHPHTEHFFVNGKFVTANYYKQPETTYAPLPPDGTEALIAKQKAVADKILDKLFPICPFAIVAGGAPRDWHFGKPAADIDVFFYSPVDQLTIVSEMLRHVGINIDNAPRTADNLPEWYKLNPNLKAVFETNVDGVNVQIMLMIGKTQDTVVPEFPFSICKAWYKHGSIQLDAEFKKCERHKIVVQTNKLYSDEHKYVQKLKNKFPDWEFFDSWEAAYKYVFEKA